MGSLIMKAAEYKYTENTRQLKEPNNESCRIQV